MAELLNNETFVWGVMGLVAFLVTQGLKWAFVKPFTKNLDKRTKTIINSVILLIAFGSAVLCEYLYSHFWLNAPIDLNRALYGWGGASGFYGVFETIIKIIKGKEVKLENLFETEEGKDTKEFLQNITKDGKINKNDKKTTDDFLEKLKSVK